MTNQEQAVESAGAAADAASSTVSREELGKAIHRRDTALERARNAEERLAQIEAANAERERSEKEAQGRFQELASEAEQRAATFEAQAHEIRQKLERLSNRHRQSVNGRFESLPEETREHLSQRLGENPDLEAFEDAVALAESLRPQTEAATTPRNIGATPSAGRIPRVDPGGKATPQEIAKMSKVEMAAYLKRNYGR
ncbi:MAG: hypothetical protein Unbinned4350contig1002_9 [Prokaryotic dsDNA virus sp.]|nr:MAG: hypothetical protein Unbinned4350contig1002_9 [Prokaryotic dsDNA virus sp.]|tara:strand:- start:14543 stop:15136 length:594 start_codon:yes stop_codon:yes gene_type:complete